MLLHIPVAVDYFYDYLESRRSSSKDQDALQVFALYIDLRMYDKICSDQELDDQQKVEAKSECATQIYDEYLREGNDDGENNAQLFVKLPEQVRLLFESKHRNLEQNLNEYLFIEVYAFVLDKLRDYFNTFKTSQKFVQLEDEIRNQERLYEVLVEASLIDN